MHVCSGNLCTKFYTLSFINNWEKSAFYLHVFQIFLLICLYSQSVILHMICHRAFSLWFVFINTCSFFGSSTMNHVLFWTSLGKYIDSTALMALPALTWVFEWQHNSWDLVIQISHTLRIIVHLALHWCPLSWKFQLRKKDKVFLKRLQLFFKFFVREKGKLYLNTKGAFHTF